MADIFNIEKEMAAAFRNSNTPIAEVLVISQKLPPDKTLVLKDTWLTLIQDDNLGYRRRLEALRLLVERGMIYPNKLDNLIVELLAPLGLDRKDFIDVTIEQNLPILREPADLVLMIQLPITIPTGSARLFVVVDRETNCVLRANVYPNLETTEVQ